MAKTDGGDAVRAAHIFMDPPMHDITQWREFRDHAMQVSFKDSFLASCPILTKKGWLYNPDLKLSVKKSQTAPKKRPYARLPAVWQVDTTFSGRPPKPLQPTNLQYNTVQDVNTVLSLPETRGRGPLPVVNPASDGHGEFGDGRRNASSPPPLPPTPPQPPTPIEVAQSRVTLEALGQREGLQAGVNNDPRKKKANKRRTAATIQIATLNMKGRGPSAPRSAASDKWNKINQIVRERKLALIAVQETHLTQAHVNKLHSLFGKRLLILHSGPPERASATRGVAFVVSRERLDAEKVHVKEVIPGRALLIMLTWYKVVTMRVLNVYAPNDHGENKAFWRALDEHWLQNENLQPDVMVDDFNIVEEKIDRLPTRQDLSGP
ncbi:hypothetical protein BC835DRAFT_1422377 [Cytidiella melzeri]|nr:hypothetical protein BC835DRAFT_1422377 [Cytidiella melzeri]